MRFLKVALVNLLVLAALWFALELGFKAARELRRAAAKPFKPSPPTDIYLGDEAGRRPVENRNADKRPNVLLVAGCSFVYGYNLFQVDTLPQLLADRAERFHVYNYGINGGAPHSFLSQFRPEQVRDAKGRAVLIYVIWEGQLGRTIGTMSPVSRNRKFETYYEVDASDRVVDRGRYMDYKPWRTALYDLLGKSSVLQYLDFDWPIPGKSDVDYMARLLKEVGQVFLHRYPHGEFYVVSYGFSKLWQGVRLKEKLEAAKIPFIDLGAEVDPDQHPKYYLPHDGHPTAKMNRRVADLLFERLLLKELR